MIPLRSTIIAVAVLAPTLMLRPNSTALAQTGCDGISHLDYNTDQMPLNFDNVQIPPATVADDVVIGVKRFVTLDPNTCTFVTAAPEMVTWADVASVDPAYDKNYHATIIDWAHYGVQPPVQNPLSAGASSAPAQVDAERWFVKHVAIMHEVIGLPTVFSSKQYNFLTPLQKALSGSI